MHLSVRLGNELCLLVFGDHPHFLPSRAHRLTVRSGFSRCVVMPYHIRHEVRVQNLVEYGSTLESVGTQHHHLTMKTKWIYVLTIQPLR